MITLVNGKVVLDANCYVIEPLRKVIEKYKENGNEIKAISYVYYMTNPTKENPFFNFEESEKESKITKYLDIDFRIDDPLLDDAITFMKESLETVTYRSYIGMKNLIDNMSAYMRETSLRDGKDGNIHSLVNAAKNMNVIRNVFKKIKEDMEEERDEEYSDLIKSRGQKHVSYDMTK